MFKALAVTLFLCLPLFADTALQYARAIEASVDSDSTDFSFVKTHMDASMNAILSVAQNELVKRGYFNEAENMKYEWSMNYGSTLFQDGRAIGDHKPIIQWINNQYYVIQALLGQDVCRLLHISDMLSLNSSNITLRPKTFPMDNVTGERVDEYVRHCAGGPKSNNEYFYGTIPVITYWFVNLGMTAVGVPIVSSLVASVAERLMDIAAVSLCTKIYNRSQ